MGLDKAIHENLVELFLESDEHNTGKGLMGSMRVLGLEEGF